MEKFEKRMRQSIASYKAPFKQHNFPQGDALNQTFEAWTTYVRRWRKERDEASSSQVGKSSRGGDSNNCCRPYAHLQT
jgi:hypothetical protein